MNISLGTDAGYIGTFQGVKGEPNMFFNTMGRVTYAVTRISMTDGYDTWREERRVPTSTADADVISSELGNGMHAPAIDIDVPIRAIPSSTPDHWHLYIEKAMTWRQYKRILRALVAAGVVEPGYYKASKGRGGTHLRLPWIKKQL